MGGTSRNFTLVIRLSSALIRAVGNQCFWRFLSFFFSAQSAVFIRVLLCIVIVDPTLNINININIQLVSAGKYMKKKAEHSINPRHYITWANWLLASRFILTILHKRGTRTELADIATVGES